jgi:DivIVA domain-containing protein
MADELTPDEVRARRFDLVRKGYDRAQVEAFLNEVATEIELLDDELETLASRDLQIGLDDREALASELHRIGSDVGAILEGARSAAEGIRSRASEDAAAWREEAEAEVTTSRAAAIEQSQAMRASAWKEGSALLASAASEAKAIIAAAKEEVLFVRAEAEREALRLTGDARRDREETIRAARVESDQLLEASRIEADGVLAAASHQAELAQERARALEDRRSELLGELETARAAIGELETEIESRRQELDTPPEPEPIIDERSHHTGDSGSVRIVSQAHVVPLKPVDAEEFVAEVTALRSGLAALPPVEPEPAVAPAPEPPEVVIASDSAKPPPAPTPTPEPLAATEDAEGSGHAVAETGASPAHGDGEDSMTDETDGPGPVDAVQPEPTQIEGDAATSVAIPESTLAASTGDEIGSLFARLRTTPEDSSEIEPTSEAGERTSEPQDIEADAPSIQNAPQSAKSRDDNPVAEAPPRPDGTSIPAQNEALRSIKRTLVELQNATLEHLRTDGAWSPDESFTDHFSDVFGDLAVAVGGERSGAAGDAFAADLYDAVSSAIDRVRDDGGGEREVAAAASKVFRTWRSDEAERRVVDAADALAPV